MSTAYQLPFPNWDPMMRLGEVERALRNIFPECCPSRPTLLAMCQEGVLTGIQLGRGRNWFVYKSSLDQFILDVQSLSQQKLAA